MIKLTDILREVRKPLYGYHVTDKKNLPSIKRTGLEPRVPEDYGEHGDVKGVYLFKTEDDAHTALGSWLGNRIEDFEEESGEEYKEIILKVNLSGLEQELIDSVEFEWICTGAISPDRIVDIDWQGNE